MARKPRIEFEGAFYHVIVRGNQRQKIFRDEKDYRKYLEILCRYKRQYKFALYSYVLMSNHVHLLLESKDIPLSRIQQGINQSYTMYFNKRHKTVGHLFQGRYKAILCDRDAYLTSLVKYIHMNPLRAKVVRSLNDYKWSSHRNYAERFKEDIVDVDQVLRLFSEGKAQARKLYRAYMGDGLTIKKDDIYRTVDQRILGDEHFVEKTMERTDAGIERRRKKHQHSIQEISEMVEQSTGITLKQVRRKSKDRGVSIGRKLMSLVASEYGYKGKEIAKYIGRDPVVITRYLKAKDDFTKEVEHICCLLKEKTGNVNK